MKKLFFFLLFCTFNLSAYELTPYDSLNPFWKHYFEELDVAIEENFWGNFGIYKKTELYGDPYILQMKEMGYCLDPGNEHPASFYQSMQWVFNQFNAHIQNGTLTEDDILWPAKAFAVNDQYYFIPIGGEIPENATPLNLLTPDVFVNMLSKGFFPMGDAIREHTNQTLAEHDLAHMAGFISSPRYTKSVREAFRRVQKKAAANPRLSKALQNFDSAYSLRLYYLIEIFTEIPENKKSELYELIGFPIDQPFTKENISAFLLQKAENPAELYRYLANIYWRFHTLVNPLGGESRDVLNRRRKYHRGDTFGSFYDEVSQFTSKFSGSSLYAIFLNAKGALENKRSNHSDFLRSIEEIHAPIIGSLLGTSLLSVEDWVLQAVEEKPDPSSKLYRYLHDSGFWDERHIIYRVYCTEEYDTILKNK